MTVLIGVTTEQLPPTAAYKPVNVGQSAAYPDAVLAAGGTPVLLPLTADEAGLRRTYDGVHGLLLAGGADISPSIYGASPHPASGPFQPGRDDAEAAWLRWALADGKPVLAICRGMQLLNAVCGGTLYQDIPSEVAGALDHRGSDTAQDVQLLAHEVRIAEDSVLAQVLSTTRVGVNARHHQAVRDVAPGYRAVAWTDDGIIEALEPLAPTSYVMAVQHHPESLVPHVEPVWLELFRSFVAAAETYASAARDSP